MPHKTSSKKSSRAKKTPSLQSDAATRRLRQPVYQSFRLAKRIKHPGPHLSSARVLFKGAIKHLWAHKKLFGSITLIYLALSLLLVRGFLFTGDITAAKDALREIFTGAGGQLATSFTILGLLIGTNSPGNEVASAYQTILILITSLALIWALRQTHAAQKITVKDTFYKSMYPLIPFVLVVMVVGLQLIPLLTGSFLYASVVGAGLAATVVEKLLWITLVFLLALWSIYMIASSLFALYIVTLPDMTPLRALRSAKNLVHFRRWTIIRKLLFLPFVIVLLAVVVMIPVILVVTPLAEIIFLILSAASLAVIHSYLYVLYRELL